MSPAAELTCLIIIPVLARPHRVAPLLADIRAATPEPHRVLFVADVDDEPELAALEAAGAEYIAVDQPRNYAAKINAAYRASTESVLLMAADDIHFHPGWLPAALAQLSDEIQVVGTNDLGNARVMKGEHSTHTLFTRHYIETESGVLDTPGTVLFEGYPHDYCDDEFIGTARARGRFAAALNSHVEHLHYAWGKGETDEVYEKARKNVSVGRKLHIARRNMWRRLPKPGTPAKRIAIYTANCGGHDIMLPQVEQNIDVDWIYFTDTDVEHDGPWEVRTLPPWPGREPSMVAKVPRMKPREFLPDYDAAIWIDANMSVHSPNFASEALACLRNGMAVWKHPHRRCIYEEARASVRLAPAKYAHLPVLEQVEAYRQEGHPTRGGLFACGTIAWDLHHDKAMELGSSWLDECDLWTTQDQLSLPVICRRMGISPGVFPYPQVTRRALRNPWLSIHPHHKDV